MAELRDLVPSEFKDDLSEAEKLILEKAPKGEPADCREIDRKDYDVEKPEEWPESRTVRAKFLEWLLRDKNAQMLIHDKGVRINGIRLRNQLDLACIRLPFPIEIFNSRFEGRLNLYNADVQEIDLHGSFIAGMYADLMAMKGSLFLRNIVSKGEMRLVGADIGGNLSCTGAEFINKNGKAFAGDRITTKGTVFLNEIESTSDFRLVNANIGGNLDCGRAKFINEKSDSFSGDTITTKGNFFLRGIESTGEFWLVGANIGGNLECTGAKFINVKGESFNSGTMITKGTVFLRGIESRGIFGLIGANIGGNLECHDAKFINTKGESFIGDTITTKGDIFLNQIESKGEFRLVSTHIGGDLYCAGASFQNREETALRLTQAQIDGRLCLDGIKEIIGILMMPNVKASALRDDAESWPDQGNLIINGFEYDSFAEATPSDLDKRLEWLKLQPEGEYIPQPYQQLAKVYRKMGRDTDAKKVLLEKERMRRRYGDIGKLAKSWGWFLDVTIGYGYQIGKTLGIVAVIIALGAFIFGFSNCYNIIQLTSEGTTEKALLEFSPLFYSIDVFVPFLDLRQENHWMVNANVKWGGWVQLYCYLHIISGWVFSTLLVASFTGLIRRE